MHFALSEEQSAIQNTALAFARERIAPHAVAWDEAAHFPTDVIREAAALGMAAMMWLASPALTFPPIRAARGLPVSTAR